MKTEQASTNKELIFGTPTCIDINGALYLNPEATPSVVVCQLCPWVPPDAPTSVPPGPKDSTTTATTNLGEVQLEYEEESDSGDRELGDLNGLRNEGSDVDTSGRGDPPKDNHFEETSCIQSQRVVDRPRREEKHPNTRLVTSASVDAKQKKYSYTCNLCNCTFLDNE